MFLFLAKTIFSQEPQFTQFYANTMYLNPAFTGLTYENRFALNYRNQWPGIKNGFSTYIASFDHNMSHLHSGVGFFAMQDVSGTSNLTSTQFGGNFAYSFRLNKYNEVRTGALISIVQRKIDNSRLVFNDQLITGSPLSLDAQNIQQINFADLGIGGVINSENYWLGIAIKHINQPNTSMNGGNSTQAMYYNVHGGYRFNLSGQKTGKTNLEEYLRASFNIRAEKNYAQMDIGAYYFRSFLDIGVWYRGLPFKSYKPGYPTKETVAFLFGYDLTSKNLRIGYSYDVTVSKLGTSTTQGAHEVSIVYELAKKRKKTRKVLVSCPKF